MLKIITLSSDQLFAEYAALKALDYPNDAVQKRGSGRLIGGQHGSRIEPQEQNNNLHGSLNSLEE